MVPHCGFDLHLRATDYNLIDSSTPDTEDLLRGLSNSVTEGFIPKRL